MPVTSRVEPLKVEALTVERFSEALDSASKVEGCPLEQTLSVLEIEADFSLALGDDPLSEGRAAGQKLVGWSSGRVLEMREDACGMGSSDKRLAGWSSGRVLETREVARGKGSSDDIAASALLSCKPRDSL